MTVDVLRIAAMSLACLLGLWTAVACRRARLQGLPGSDAVGWVGLSAVFFLLSLMRTARGLGLLHGLGTMLRHVFKQMGWYDARRNLQITAGIAVAILAVVVFAWGLVRFWYYVKHYRLAVGFAGIVVGFGLLRFISLHEVDALVANAPWARTVVDLVVATGVAATAVARLRNLHAIEATRHR